MDVDPQEQDVSEDVHMGFIGCLEPSRDDFVSQLLLDQLGGSKSYIREQRSACRRIVSEIYSPERITKEIKNGKFNNLIPGFAFDLTNVDPYDNRPWDFSRRSKRVRARKLIREQKPYMLIGSPMCRAFSTWQALNRARSGDKKAMDEAYEAARVHITFCRSIVPRPA